MKHEIIDIDLLKEYENNTKIHTEEQVEQIAESIKKFGMNDPIGVDENNTILEGHGRYLALKKLNYKEVPIFRIEHLTEEEKRAYIIAHNATNLATGLDKKLLKIELEGIKSIDMSNFGIKPIELKSDIPEVKEHHRDMTMNQYNLYDYNDEFIEGRFDIPIIEATDYIPEKLQGFNYVLNKPDLEAGVHFFLDDYQFERIWRNPDEYIMKLKNFPCVLTPDFSLYIDMPLAMQVWNIYRSRLIGQKMQSEGITVIPTVSWSDERSFEFCFDGLPKNSTLAISTIGVKQDKDLLSIWEDGVIEMIERLNPENLIVYGGKVNFDFKNINVVYIENQVTERMKNFEK